MMCTPVEYRLSVLYNFVLLILALKLSEIHYLMKDLDTLE